MVTDRETYLFSFIYILGSVPATASSIINLSHAVVNVMVYTQGHLNSITGCCKKVQNKAFSQKSGF